MRLKDRVAIVSGAGSVGPGWGNGRATAVRLAEEGAKVFAVDRNEDSLRETIARVEQAGGVIQTHVCDVTSGIAVAELVIQCVKAFGKIDILVNNVGGSAKGGPVEMSEEVWDAQVDFNLKSVFLA
jgi:NAD(P)-dependent dehydrogenase (short-subunit alcohol dehydrogenase family)